MDDELRVVPLSDSNIRDALDVIKDAFGDEDEEEVEILRFSLTLAKKKLFNCLEFLVLERSGEAVGVMGMGAMRYEPADLAWVLYPAIMERFQGKGYGKILMGGLERLAKEKGIARLYADTSTTPDDENAKRFYERCGFVKAGGITPYFSDGSGLEYRMKKL